jgi:hypothetical protein
MFSEHDRIVLSAPLPRLQLVPGDVGTIVHVYRDGQAYEVEFVWSMVVRLPLRRSKHRRCNVLARMKLLTLAGVSVQNRQPCRSTGRSNTCR